MVIARACTALAILALGVGTLLMHLRFIQNDDAAGLQALFAVWPLTMLVVWLLGAAALLALQRSWRYFLRWTGTCALVIPSYLVLAYMAGTANAVSTNVNLNIGLLIIDAVVVIVGWVCITGRD